MGTHMKTRKIESLVKSAKYLPLIMIIVAITLALIKATTVYGTGDYDPNEVSLH